MSQDKEDCLLSSEISDLQPRILHAIKLSTKCEDITQEPRNLISSATFVTKLFKDVFQQNKGVNT